MNVNEIRDLEKKAAQGWPGLEILEYDGWELRFSIGYTGRANSVSVYEDSTKRLEDKVVYCENLYSDHNIPCNFKVTDADKELSEYLLNRGYKIVTPSDVMMLDMDSEAFKEVIKNSESDKTLASGLYENVNFSDEPSEWFDPYFEFEGFTDEKKIETYKQIHANTEITKLYVTGMHEEKPAAVASCAIEGEYSLLHNVIVDKKFRGLGLGRKVCLSATLKSKEMGAKYSYLQVVKNNDVAISLYKKLGFVKVYEYYYLKQN